MKKLMVMMAAVATGFAAWASALSQQVAYTVDQNLAVGPTNIVGYSDDLQKKVGDHDAVIHWWMDDFTVDTDEDPISIAEDSVKGKVLQLETGADTPVLRTFNPLLVTTATDPMEIEKDPVDIEDHGTFIDTWVKLSASEGVQEPVAGDKISIWLQVVDEETDDQGEVVVPASTNLVVTCGALDGEFNAAPTNIVLNATVEPDTWHRITIRAMKQIAADTAVQNIGFVVFLDEGIVAAKEGAYLDFTGIALSDKAQTYAQNRQLFPSLQKDTAATLTAAGFAGVGQIASVNLDTQYSAPAFAKDPTFVKITWDANVESIKLGGQELIGEAAIGETNIQVLAFGVDATQTLAIKYANTYKCDKVTGSANLATFDDDPDGDGKGEAATFSLYEYANGQIDITSQRDREGARAYVFDSTAGEFVPLFDGATQPYLFNMVGKIAEAIELGEIDPDATVKIVLLEDEVADTTGDWSLLANVILDLNGHSLTASENWTGGWSTEDPSAALMNNALIGNLANLEIVDSVGGGAIAGNPERTPIPLAAVFNGGEGSSLTIGESVGAGMIVTGTVANVSATAAITVLGGKYTEEVDDLEGTVKLGATDELAWLKVGDYYTLVPAEAEVVPYLVNADATAEVVVTIDGDEAAALGTIEVGSELMVVATAATGYQYTGSETVDTGWSFASGAWTFTTTAEEDNDIEVTVPTATLIPAANVVSIQVNGGDATGYADVALALAAVQSAEGAGTFPIVVTALADDVEVVNPEDPTQTITLAEGDVITITVTGWEFAQVLTGTVELAPGKTIVAANGSTATITAPEGYMIVSTPGEFTTTYEAKAILATVKIGDAAAENFCNLAAVLAAVQAAEAAEPFETIVVTAVGAARTLAAEDQTITLGQNETITIAEVGSWQFSNLFAGNVTLVAGAKIIAKGIAYGSAINVDEANGYELKTSGPVEEYYTYTAELKKLTATFYDENGTTVLYTDANVVYGTVPEYKGETPAKAGYTFAGWNPAIAAITANASYVATYTPNPATLTLPETATGIATTTVYESDDAKATWKPVTVGESGTYAIAAGNYYKVAVTAAQHYELKNPAVDAIISDAAVEAGAAIMIKAADLEALVQLHSYNITYKQVNEQPITGLNPATFTIADTVTLPADLGAQLGGTFNGWYANAALTGDPITGWAAGEQTDNVTVYAKIEQVVDEPAEIVKDKVNVPDDATDAQKKAIHDNAQLIYTKFGTKELAEAWIASVYGEGVKIDGAKLAAASAENVEIAMKYDIEIMEDPVIEFNATVAATEGNVAAFTFQIKDGDEGEAVSLAKAKVLSMVQYCSTLGSWAPATSENVEVSVDDDTAKVQLIQKTGITAGFMKIQLTAPAEEAK